MLSGDLIVFIDADIRNFDPHFVYGLLGPLLVEEGVQYVKAIYERPIAVEKGGELAVFEMGSTVVALFARGVKLSPRLQPGLRIRLGEALE